MGKFLVPTLALLSAAAALGSAARHRSHREHANQLLRGGLKSNELQGLWTFVHSSDAKLRNKAQDAAAQLAMKDAYLPHLLSLCQGGGSPREQHMASAVVAHLAKSEINKQAIIDASGASILCELLKSNARSRVRTHAAAAVYYLIKGNNDRRMLLVSCDLLPTVLEVLLSYESCPYKLVQNCMMILLELAQFEPLRDALQQNDAHVVACKLWHDNMGNKDLEQPAISVVQCMLEASDHTQAKAILGDLAPFKIAAMACAMLLNESTQARALPFIFYMVKNGIYIDELVKKPYLASTILKLIAKDSYSKALMALVCLDVLCDVSESIANEIVQSDILKNIYTCIMYGNDVLRMAALNVVRQMIEHGLPASALRTANVLPLVFKHCGTLFAAASVLWALAGDADLLHDDAVLGSVVKMIKATDAQVVVTGLRLAAVLIGRDEHASAAAAPLANSHHLFDALRKCLLQSSQHTLAYAAAKLIMALVVRGLVSVDTVASSVAQPLLHNLQVRIPEAKDLLRKLLVQHRDEKLNAVALLSFAEAHKKLKALGLAFAVVVAHRGVWRRLWRRHQYELEMMVHQALWFVASVHNDENGKLIAPVGFPKIVAEIQKVQGAGVASKPLEMNPTSADGKRLVEVWMDVVYVMTFLLNCFADHDETRAHVDKGQYVHRAFLGFVLTDTVISFLALHASLQRKPVAHRWRDHPEVLEYMARLRQHLQGASTKSSGVTDASTVYMLAFLDTILVQAAFPAGHDKWGRAGTEPSALLALAEDDDDDEDETALGAAPTALQVERDRRRAAWRPVGRGPRATALATVSVTTGGTVAHAPAWRPAAVAATYGVGRAPDRARAALKYAFRVMVAGTAALANVGWATHSWAPVPALGNVLGQGTDEYAVDGAHGLKLAQGKCTKGPITWAAFRPVLMLLDLEAGQMLALPDGATSPTVLFKDIDVDKVWFPAASLETTAVLVDFDPANLPEGYISIEEARRVGEAVFLDDVRDADESLESVPTPLVSRRSSASESFPFTYYRPPPNRPVRDLPCVPQYYYETQVYWTAGPQMLGWRTRDNTFLLFVLHGGYEAVVVTTRPDLPIPFAALDAAIKAETWPVEVPLDSEVTASDSDESTTATPAAAPCHRIYMARRPPASRAAVPVPTAPVALGIGYSAKDRTLFLARPAHQHPSPDDDDEDEDEDVRDTVVVVDRDDIFAEVPDVLADTGARLMPYLHGFHDIGGLVMHPADLACSALRSGGKVKKEVEEGLLAAYAIQMGLVADAE
ncbi:hypothetical protein GGF32_007854 [Allomyces javanicus]|nr:hypothetical protein GGF32_007854 [Allomyces javanicus]